MKKLTIHDPHTGRNLVVPHSMQRLCAGCLNPMRLDHVRWDTDKSGEIIYLCQHTYGSRFKRVTFSLDKKGRLS